MTLLLIVLGAMVTSNDAGLSVPDWPTSFGSLYKIPPMVGGVKYEHGHRMFAEFVGLLIIVMAVWTQRVESRKWMKALGWIALGAVVGQGVLGGLTVLFGLPWSFRPPTPRSRRRSSVSSRPWRSSPAKAGCRMPSPSRKTD